MKRAVLKFVIGLSVLQVARASVWGQDVAIYSDGDGTCYVKGVRFYMQESVFLNAGYSQVPGENARYCQSQCKQNPRCSHWTLSIKDDDANQITKGACFLYDNTAAHEKNPNYVSGMTNCPATKAGSFVIEPVTATNTNGVVPVVVPAKTPAAVASTIAPATTAEPLASEDTPKVEGISDSDSGSSGGFPTWGYVLIALGVTAAAAAAYYGFAAGAAPKQKKKKKARAIKTKDVTGDMEIAAAAEPATAQESAPLVQSTPAAGNVGSVAGAQPASWVAAPQQVAPRAAYGYGQSGVFPQQMAPQAAHGYGQSGAFSQQMSYVSAPQAMPYMQYR